jgi:hypothetical protein
VIYAFRSPIHSHIARKRDEVRSMRLMDVGGIAKSTEDVLRSHDVALDAVPVDGDPMPGVHMVYMYVNGSDPAVSRARERYGGTKAGRTDCACNRYARL